MEVTRIEKRQIVILLSVVAVAAMLGGVYWTAYAADPADAGTALPGYCGRGGGMRGGWRHGGRRVGSIDVSESYTAAVLSVVNDDGDVQALLAEGYVVNEDVRPLLRPHVDAEGAVTQTATNAIVVLEKDDDNTTYRATVWVDLDADRVTQIVVLSRTVIDKSS
jgi:hypothetical protein